MERNTEKEKKFLLITATFITLSVLSLLLYNYSAEIEKVQQIDLDAQAKRRNSEKRKTQSINNPIWPLLQQYGRKYNFRIDYAQKSAYFTEWQSFPSGLFCHEPGSLDILLIGDSTLAWGTVPQIIEDVSGLRTGMFALRSLYLNARTVKSFRRIADIYLKKTGKIIFGFDHFTQDVESNLLHYSEDDLGKIDSMDNKELKEFLEKRYQQCTSKKMEWPQNIWPQEKQGLWEKILLTYSDKALKGYHRRINEARTLLRENLFLFIPEETIVHKIFVKLVHPNWYEKKRKEEKKTGLQKKDAKNIYELDRSGSTSDIKRWAIIKWDFHSSTLFQRFEPRGSIFSQAGPYRNFKPSDRLQKNAGEVKKLPYKMIYLISYYDSDDKYRLSRSFYQRLYSDKLKLIDLGKMHPRDKGFPLDKVNHTINETGLLKSIQIGQWLKRNKNKIGN